MPRRTVRCGRNHPRLTKDEVMKSISGKSWRLRAPTDGKGLTRNSVKLGLLGMGVAVLAATLVATPAGADSKPVTAPRGQSRAQPSGRVPAGFADWDQLWAYQARLDSAAQRILAAGDAGNPSVVVDPTNHELRVYWHGTVPATVRATAARAGVPVSFHPATFAHRELVTEAKRMAAGGGVLSAAPATDGSGLAVTVEKALAPAAQSGLRTRSRVPLSITLGTRLQATAGRQNDTPAFWGGSKYLTLTGDCSNGIPIKYGSVARMMTAAHCSPHETAVTIPGQPSPTGTTGTTIPCRDTQLINYPAGIAPILYNGPFNASSATNVSIAGATPDFVGDLIVTDGASSGEHAGIKVQFTDKFEESIGGIACAPVGPLTEAFSLDNTCVQAPGDSGGPVYSYLTPNLNVLVRGTITGGNSGKPCPGNVGTGGFEVIYAPLVRPSGDAEVGSLGIYGAVLYGIPLFDLTGTWTDGPGRGPGPVITVQGQGLPLPNQAITVDMSRFHRPTAHGRFIDETHISVTFPDDKTYTGALLAPGTILWNNNTLWTKI
jgi:hypothetical protein